MRHWSPVEDLTEPFATPSPTDGAPRCFTLPFPRPSPTEGTPDDFTLPLAIPFPTDGGVTTVGGVEPPTAVAVCATANLMAELQASAAKRQREITRTARLR